MQTSGSRPSRQQRRAAARKQGKTAHKGALASGAVLTLGVALASGQPLEAAVFDVTNLNDAGAGSLRQAIEDANGAAGADTITFQAGLTGTITLTTGQLAITDSVDIQGPGAAALAVSGNNASRVFYLYNGSAVLDVIISGLTITGGSATIGAGLVNFDENLTLDAVTITGNAASGDGGGLWADGFNMNLNILNSSITGNTSGADGGGIYIEDTGGLLAIRNTVISGNQAANSGGGIYFYDPDDDVTIEDSTISGNTAGTTGGGIYLYSPDAGSDLISRSTISGNSAAAGGGLFLYSPDQPFVIENSTISGNSATAGDGGGLYLYNYGLTLRHTTIAGNTASGTGGGVFSQTAPVTVASSIVGDNTAGAGNDLGNGSDGSFNVSFSLVESATGANVNDNGGNVFNQDPQLSALANNGGPTQTHLPAAASPAVNAGDPAFVPPPATDQRGSARVVGGRIDMGSVELNPGTIQLTVATASVNENAGTVTITATRTGGADGPVSVSYVTSDGSAVSPADYASAVGNLSWANQDTAPKSFNVTIVNDGLDEGDETFNVVISAPTGGATLGSPTTEVVTIVDDDTVAAIEVPTLGDVGKMLFVAVLGLGGLLLLRRRKALAAPMLALSLAAGAGAAEAAQAKAEVRAAAISQITQQGSSVVVRLTDGTTLTVSSDKLNVVDSRRGQRGSRPDLRTLPASQPVVLKVKTVDGTVRRVRLELVDTAAQADARATDEREGAQQ